ncbi:MAG: DMT family transporter [Pseudomonadota bacterium]
MGAEVDTTGRARTRDRARGALAVALSAAAFGAMPIFARQAYAASVDLTGILVPRFAVAALVLALVAWRSGARRPTRRQTLALAALGGIGYVAQSFLYFTALKHASAGLVALLLYAFPFVVAVLAAIFLNERLTARRVAALLVASGGLALTIGGGQGSALGVALGLGAALVYAVYIVAGTRVMREVDPLAASSVVCAAAAASYTLVALARGALGLPAQLPHDAAGWLSVGAIALVSTVVAIAAFFYGLQRLGASLTSVLSTLEPVVSVLLAALVLGEAVTPAQALGGALVIATAIWLALDRRDR